ncbi:hypothetical protein LZL87_013459 [Fusarium oxysporum]|nr:hypothetical protein LZL87_013459 [Fusarium oxysporum]
MAYRRDNDDRTPLASDSQANNDAAYEDHMRRYQARHPYSNWELETRRMVGPMYNPTPWLSPTSPVYLPAPTPGDWDRSLCTAFKAELQSRQDIDESPQWEYVPGEGYRQVESGTRSGANQQHYSRRANGQRRENERMFLRDVQSEVARDNGFPQIGRRETPDTRSGPDTNARAPIPDMWTATTEAREWMDEVQREVNLRGSYTRFPRSTFSDRGAWLR